MQFLDRNKDRIIGLKLYFFPRFRSMWDIMSADYYSILGVKKGTWFTERLKREMRRTYRKLALEYHPDKNESEDAMEKFKRIKTAFEVLSHPQKKRIYDLSGEEGLKRKNFN